MNGTAGETMLEGKTGGGKKQFMRKEEKRKGGR